MFEAIDIHIGDDQEFWPPLQALRITANGCGGAVRFQMENGDWREHKIDTTRAEPVTYFGKIVRVIHNAVDGCEVIGLTTNAS